MAEVVDNNKALFVIKMTPEESAKIGFGFTPGECICANCNMVINGPIYYIAVLNDTMCEDCYKKFIRTAKRYPEDDEFEESNFIYYAQLLGIDL